MHGGHSGVPSGFDLFHLREEFQGIEATGAMHFAALRKRSQDASNQAVDMKQGHDVQAAVAGSEGRAARNVLGRGTHIAMRQWNNFGA